MICKTYLYQKGNMDTSRIKEWKQIDKLSVLKEKKKSYEYALFHILKYHTINTLKKNKIDLISISHQHKSSPHNLSKTIIRL